MSDYAVWILLAAGMAGVFLFSERTKNQELLKLHRLLFREKDFEAFHRELKTVSCLVLFSKVARAYMLLNGAMLLERPRAEVEEVLQKLESMKMSKKESEACEQKRLEYEEKYKGSHF